MIGRRLVRIIFSVGIALTLAACVFTLEDGEGNAYFIAADGSVDMTSASVVNVNTIKFKSFFPWLVDTTTDATLFCRSGGEFTSILFFERAVDDWLPVIDVDEFPGTFSGLLKSTCDGELNAADGTYTFELAMTFRNRFVPFLSQDNLSCIVNYLGAGENHVVATDFCLQADVRESTFDLGLNATPGPVNILQVVLNEATVDQF